MNIETGSVDTLFEKPRIDVHRGLEKTVRGGVVKYKHFIPGFNPLVTKLFYGTASSKNQEKWMLNYILEDLSPNVFYSLKKKKRWQELSNVDSALNTMIENSPPFTVSAIQRKAERFWYMHNFIENRAMLYGRVKRNSNEIEKISAKGGNGTLLASLEDSLECRNRKDRNKRKSKRQEVKTKEPQVALFIEQQVDAQKLPAMILDPYWRPYREERKTHRFNRFLEEFLDEDDEQSMYFTDEETFDEAEEEKILNESNDKERIDDFDGEIIDGFGEEILDDFNEEMSDNIDKEVLENTRRDFVLSDFIIPSSQKKERIRQKKIQKLEFLDAIPSSSESNDYQKPLNEYDILQNASFTSSEIDFSTFFLNSEDFVPELEKWIEDNRNYVEIIWLDETKTKCLVDFSKVFKSKNLVAVIGFTLGDKSLKLTFNIDFPLTFSEKLFKNLYNKETKFTPLFNRIFYGSEQYFKPILLKENNFKSLEEAFQCKSDATVEPFNDYDLIEKFLGSEGTFFSDSSSESSLKSLHFDSCELCGHDDSSNVLNLSCIHSLCLSCAKVVFKEQMVSHSKQITCPICGSIQDLMKLAFIIPLSLIRAFLKEKFRRLSKNRIQECPKCLGYFERIPGVNSVSCKYCCISFCQDCLQPPHFPISCDQMKIWLPKFEEQYNLYCMKKPPQYGQCVCGKYIRLKQIPTFGFDSVTCQGCDRVYYGEHGNSSYQIYRGTNTFLKILKRSEIPMYIGKCFFDPCVEIRNEMKYESKAMELKKLGKEFLEENELNNFIDLRFKILKLIEYGTAWLYFERKNKLSPKNREISKTLKKLSSLLNFIINQMINKSNLRIHENLTSLQDSYSKALVIF